MDKQMDLFFEDLLNKAGLTSLSAGFRLAYKDKLYQQLMERVGLLALQKLPADKVEDYKKMVSQKSLQKELGLFLQKNVPDFENFIQEAMVKFGQDFVDINVKGRA